MGKSLIIKGANFSINAVDSTENYYRMNSFQKVLDINGMNLTQWCEYCVNNITGPNVSFFGSQNKWDLVDIGNELVGKTILGFRCLFIRNYLNDVENVTITFPDNQVFQFPQISFNESYKLIDFYLDNPCIINQSQSTFILDKSNMSGVYAMVGCALEESGYSFYLMNGYSHSFVIDWIIDSIN